MNVLDSLSNEEAASMLSNYIERRGIMNLVLDQLNFRQTVVIQVQNDSAATVMYSSSHVDVEVKNLENGEEVEYCCNCGKTEFETNISPCIHPQCQNFVCRQCHTCVDHDSEE